MTKELVQLLKKMDETEQYDFFEEGIKKRYPIIRNLKNFKDYQQLIQVTSCTFENTPKSFFRFLYLWKPKKIDFSDMYKSTIAMIKIHKNGIVILSFYKYELVAYLFTIPNEIKPCQQCDIKIVSGVPGFDNEQLKEDSEVGKEFQIFRGILEKEYEIYPGNNFIV